LRGALIRETIHTLQLDHQLIFHEDVGKVLSDWVAFIGDAAKCEFPQQGTLVDFL
jgi:hypothetical protein